jgi:hypothetical protein
MEHMYITDCQLLGSFEVFYIMLGVLYLGLIMLWRHHVWIKYPEPLSTSLQRGVISIPILKLLQICFYGLHMAGCPWPSIVQSRYYLMAILTVSTLYYTVLMGFLLALSKGWKIARQTLDRKDVSRNTLILAAVYLIFSAYYVSVNVPQMRNFVEVRLIKSHI